MTVVVGGMRVLNAGFGLSRHGVFTGRAEALTNDFFVNLLDMGTQREVFPGPEEVFEVRVRATGEPRWTATRVDLIVGSNSQLPTLAEVYGSEDSAQQVVDDFAAACSKVMSLDRSDLAQCRGRSVTAVSAVKLHRSRSKDTGEHSLVPLSCSVARPVW